MAENPLQKRLNERHPLYTARAEEWSFFGDSYEGGSTYLQGNYLFQFHREKSADYQNRIKRAVYPNYCKKIVDIYTSFIYRDAIARRTQDPALLTFIRDADRAGTPLSQVMGEHVAPVSLVYEHALVLVDMPRPLTPPVTRADDQAMDLRPYLTVYTPLETVDWAEDEDGEYEFVRFLETAPIGSDPFTPRDKPSVRYRTWTKNEWFLHAEDGTQLDGGTHGLGVVPVVRSYGISKAGEEHNRGVSLLQDIAYLNRAIFNYRSLLDEFLHLQCFNVLGLPITAELTPERLKELVSTMGTQNAFYFDGSGPPPSYITPPTDPAEILLRAIDAAAREIVELAKLQDRSKASARDKAGVAYAFEFHESNATFAKIAKNFEDTEMKIFALVAKWLKKGDAAVVVEYPTDFAVRTLYDTINEASALLTLNVSPRFNRYIRKMVTSTVIKKVDADEEKKIMDEIDTMPMMEDLDLELARVQRPLPVVEVEDDDEEDDAPEVESGVDRMVARNARQGGRRRPASEVEDD